jgi:hypothetical protein
MQATPYLCGSAPSFLDYEVLLMLHQAQVAAAGIKVHVIKKCAVDVSEVHTATIIRGMSALMEAVCTSETSINFNVTTWCYIPEDSKLQVLIAYLHTLFS